MKNIGSISTDPLTQRRIRRLLEILAPMERVLVAYSGGVDSTLLLTAAVQVLGRENATGIIADSPLHRPGEVDEALMRAGRMGFIVEKIRLNELENSFIRENNPQRCFYCKKLRFEKIIEYAKSRQIRHILEGSNADDKNDYRPGMKAVRILGIKSPLLKAGLTKAQIRLISQKMGLETHNLPSAPCLATRFPFGTALNERDLRNVAEAEAIIRETGIKTVRVRVRVLDNLACIEVPPEDFNEITVKDRASRLNEQLKSLGYSRVVLDLEGYRQGSMNESLKIEESNGPETD